MSILQNSGSEYGPLVKVNCGAIPESMLNIGLFGNKNGAFTFTLNGPLFIILEKVDLLGNTDVMRISRFHQ